MTRVTNLDEGVRALRRALGKLPATTDRKIARRNARARVLGALRKIRALVDEKYPAIVDRAAPRVRRPADQRMKALVKAGWKRIQNVAPGFAAAGVPVKRVAWRIRSASYSPATYVKGKGWVQGKTETVVDHQAFFIPDWARIIGPDKPTELRAAKKSRTLQKATLVAEALRS